MQILGLQNYSAACKKRRVQELRMLKSYLAFTSAVHHVLTRAYERLGAAIAHVSSVRFVTHK